MQRAAELDQAHRRGHGSERRRDALGDPVGERARRPADHAVRRRRTGRASRSATPTAPGPRRSRPASPHGATSSSAVTAVAGPDNQTPSTSSTTAAISGFRSARPAGRAGTEVHIGDTQLGGHVEGNGAAVRPRRRRPLLAQLVQLDRSARGLPAAVRPGHRPADRQRRARAEVDRCAELRRRPHGTRLRRASAASSTTRPTRRATTRPTWTSGASATPTRPVSATRSSRMPASQRRRAERRHVDRLARGRHAGLPRRARQRQRLGRQQPEHRPADEGRPPGAQHRDGRTRRRPDLRHELARHRPATDALWARVIPGTAPVYTGPTKKTSTKVGTTAADARLAEELRPAGEQDRREAARQGGQEAPSRGRQGSGVHQGEVGRLPDRRQAQEARQAQAVQGHAGPRPACSRARRTSSRRARC